MIYMFPGKVLYLFFLSQSRKRPLNKNSLRLLLRGLVSYFSLLFSFLPFNFPSIWASSAYLLIHYTSVSFSFLFFSYT
ncbi:hypothetical protein BDF21DRAFT_415116 [Thamnidium elegans]|nr:hypothetical protein BDF21DRAFT_415116 [Thamnidium elegans]